MGNLSLGVVSVSGAREKGIDNNMEKAFEKITIPGLLLCRVLKESWSTSDQKQDAAAKLIDINLNASIPGSYLASGYCNNYA